MEEIKNLLDTCTDTTIMYQGGSGGFLLYFLLLLSGNYVSGDIDIHQSSDTVSTVKQRILTQFPYSLKNNQSQWKTIEFWPDNRSIKDIPLHKNKLFLICNPLFDSRHVADNLSIASNTRRVLLYTDINLQLRMAYEKNAYWFTDISKKKFNAPASNYGYIRQIKSSYKLLENKKVDPRVPDIIKLYQPNIVVNLKDIISNTGFNQDQTTFLTHWLSLQSKESHSMLNDLEHFIIVYNPGYAGNFLLRLFSLGEEVVPQLPVNLLVENNLQIYSLNDRLNLYSFSTVRSQYMNWQKFHRDWIDFSHYEKLNCMSHPDYKHIVFAMHVPELEMHEPVLRSIQNIKYFYVNLDLKKYSNWINSAQQDLNFKYRIDEKSKYQYLVECAASDQLINLTAMLESSDKFLQEYRRICTVMKITPVEDQALILYREWYDTRVAHYFI